jgi:prophage regulatory protein
MRENLMELENLKPKERILRLEDVKERTGLSRSTIYLNVNKGTFPSPINLGARCVGWLESELDNWIVARIQKSRPQENTS